MRALVLALPLAACAAASPSSGPGPGPARGLTLVPVADGLEVAGSGGRRIGFGRDRAGAVASAARVAGAAPRAVACAAGTGVAVGDLVMVFDGRDAFAGWTTPEAAAGLRC